MPTKRVRDLCGLNCVVEFADYKRAEFFMYLIGTGVSRSRYELTAHDRKTGVLLFDMQVDAAAPALEARARRAGTSTDAQAVVVALEHARQLVDADHCSPGTRFLLQVESEAASLQQIGVGRIRGISRK